MRTGWALAFLLLAAVAPQAIAFDPHPDPPNPWALPVEPVAEDPTDRAPLDTVPVPGIPGPSEEPGSTGSSPEDPRNPPVDVDPAVPPIGRDRQGPSGSPEVPSGPEREPSSRDGQTPPAEAQAAYSSARALVGYALGQIDPEPAPCEVPATGHVAAVGCAPEFPVPSLPDENDAPHAAVTQAPRTFRLGGLAAGAAAAAVVGLGMLGVLLSPFFSRLTRGSILAHPRRERLLELARTRPGIAMHEAARTVDMPWTKGLYHARRLEKAGLLRIHKHGGRVVLFPTTIRPSDADRFVQLNRPTPARLHQIIVQNPGLDQDALAARLGLTRVRVTQVLGALTEAGLVAAKRHARRNRYLAIDSSAPRHDGS